MPLGWKGFSDISTLAYWAYKNGATAFSIKTFSIMTLGIRTLGISI
jgi:hypothetical protein